ncbi:MAG: 6-carboxytetrahydropterin synthase QueD [Proteobacteria bacterium]|nr:6-carboxytetrahydropterin synthase QueD [Pseudomonadota bacterium]
MPGIFEVSIKTHFSAAHALRGYPGDCARLHGHNWTVRVWIRCRELDETGIGIDFRVVKNHVKAVLQRLDHCNMNELTPFVETNPSSENIARYLYGELSRSINSDRVKVAKIGVSETPDAGACYWEE